MTLFLEMTLRDVLRKEGRYKKHLMTLSMVVANLGTLTL